MAVPPYNFCEGPLSFNVIDKKMTHIKKFNCIRHPVYPNRHTHRLNKLVHYSPCSPFPIVFAQELLS